MKQKIKNLKYIFNPKSIAIIGASKLSSKVGGVIIKNLVDGKFQGKVYPINPKYKEVFGLNCYSSVLEVDKKIDCAVIAIPAKFVPKVLGECGRKNIKGVIIISGGFAEVGNFELDNQIKKISDKYEMAVLGPNVLGVLNPYERVDSVFLPMYKLGRPRPGGISIITQSGAVGTCVVDLAAKYGVGIAKFISYGNGTVIDESDLLEFLEHDKQTDQILLYIEGIKNGRKLLDISKRVNKKKPIVVLKAGRSEKASKAAVSHTGNIAGSYLAYKSAFRQAKLITANSLDELFGFVKIFNQPLPKGDKIGIITNGGGLGVLTTDVLEEKKLDLAEFSDETKKRLRKIIPSYATAQNPLDVIADADSEVYSSVLDIMLNDKNINAIIVIVLFQAPAIDERLINVLIKDSDRRKKPIIAMAVGGEYTDGHRKILDSYGIPTYKSPSNAVNALRKLVDYAKYRKSWVNERK